MPSESQSRGEGRSWDTRRCPPPPPPPPPLGDFNASIFLAFAATSSSKTEEEANPIEDAFIVWFVIRWRGLRCCCSDSLILLLYRFFFFFFFSNNGGVWDAHVPALFI
jgi:hypothetical protein